MAVTIREGERLDILALAPLPARLNGDAALQVGGSLQCAWLLTGLARLGHTVRVLSVGPLQPSDVQPGDLGPAVSVDWFAVEKLDTAQPPSPEDVARRRAQFEAALDRALADRRPDVVILGNESHPWYAAGPCRERGLRTVAIAQGVPTAGLPAGIYPPSAVRAFTDRLLEVDLVVTVSSELEAVLRGLGLKRLRTIETGIDTDAFRPRPKDASLLAAHDIPPDAFVVGSFVHMRPEKRIADIVSSAEIVLRSEPSAVYLIAGTGPLREETIAIVEEKGLRGSFRFVGELDHGDVPAHMALCDAVVLASEREGYSLVCREAQASGCGLIASDIPAGHAATRGGSAGLTFRLGDIGDLAAKTLALARDAELRHSLAERGRAAAAQNGGDGWIGDWSDAIVATVRRRERAAQALERGGMNELALVERDGQLAVRKRYYTKDTQRRKSFGSGARNEALLHAQLGDLLPAELAAETSQAGGYEEVLLEWRDGTALDPGQADRAQARSAGAALARIHAVPGDRYGSLDGRHRFESQADAFSRRWAQAIRVVGGVDARLADLLGRWGRPQLAELRWPHPALVHGDFGVTNLLWTGSDVSSVLDWEYARFGDPREDWSKVTMGTRFAEPNSFGDDEVLTALTDGYLVAGGEPAAVEPVDLYDAYYTAVLAVALQSDARLRWLHDLVGAGAGPCP